MSKLKHGYVTKLLARVEKQDGVMYWKATKSTAARKMAHPFCDCHPFQLFTDSVEYVHDTGDMDGLVVTGLTKLAQLQELLIKEMR